MPKSNQNKDESEATSANDRHTVNSNENNDKTQTDYIPTTTIPKDDIADTSPTTALPIQTSYLAQTSLPSSVETQHSGTIPARTVKTIVRVVSFDMKKMLSKLRSMSDSMNDHKLNTFIPHEHKFYDYKPIQVQLPSQVKLSEIWKIPRIPSRGRG